MALEGPLAEAELGEFNSGLCIGLGGMGRCVDDETAAKGEALVALPAKWLTCVTIH